VLENPDLYYPQQAFLSLIQALESYCQKDLNSELKKLERTEEEHSKIFLITQLAPRTARLSRRVVHRYQSIHGTQRDPVPERPLPV
jgi:hypothetical protein